MILILSAIIRAETSSHIWEIGLIYTGKFFIFTIFEK